MKDFKDVYRETSSSETLTLGDTTSNGNILLKDSKGLTTIDMRGEYGVIYLGGKNLRSSDDGDLIIRDYTGKDVLKLDGNHARIIAGGEGTSGSIFMRNSNDIDTLKILGSSGDIEFLNADFAEEFDMAEDQMDELEAGKVVVLREDGKLIQSTSAYDSKVAGVIAGAGDYKPGIVMDKQGGENRMPIALLGKVSCWVDADQAPIQVGDLLTTSGTAGHAMKVTDSSKALGAVIGKALQPLEKGKGMITVLVNLH
ncbi:MAG: hypothetical protein HWE22_06085 [Flavobacteriales bacterium]|nr:hypothetical protein [Flavobacteriales bacterium]